jgi:hypothetical protein
MPDGLKYIQTAEEFVKWATNAKRGHRVCYYRGWLMKDKLSKMPHMVKNDLVLPEFRTAHKAWDFYAMGTVELFQKRMGDEDYLYIAVAT